MKTKSVYVFVSSVLLFILLHEGCASNDEKLRDVENQYVICEKESVKGVSNF